MGGGISAWAVTSIWCTISVPPYMFHLAILSGNLPSGIHKFPHLLHIVPFIYHIVGHSVGVVYANRWLGLHISTMNTRRLTVSEMGCCPHIGSCHRHEMNCGWYGSLMWGNWHYNWWTGHIGHAYGMRNSSDMRLITQHLLQPIDRFAETGDEIKFSSLVVPEGVKMTICGAASDRHFS